MKVLVIGSGGREHAIVDAISKSKKVSKIYAAPGNAGIAKLATIVQIGDTSVEDLVEFAINTKIDLVVVGPESSLAAGVVDAMQKAGIKAFGPNKAAARIESSKEFAKDLMKKYNIPTAAYEVFDDYNKACEYVKNHGLPIVLKYDGLAAGKGVVIPESLEEAYNTLHDMLVDDKFGDASVVIEDYLEGPEFSFMCFVSNDKVYKMEISQDHKRAYDGDLGPNTGGMGAYSPVPCITKEDIDYAYENIMVPTALAMIKEGCPFKGVLYGGLMKTKDGVKVIEFNSRFGDPETEVVLPRLESDIVDIFLGIIDGSDNIEIKWSKECTLGIVLASKGYPLDYKKGFVIEGLDEIDAKVYHMGTKLVDGNYVTNGGRVLFVVAKGNNIKEAKEKALAEVQKIKCDNLFYRKDIGHRALN
ncbi:MAG: phosphoribosylamine--glycine ligase [Anaeroplasmataceae bacterium]